MSDSDTADRLARLQASRRATHGDSHASSRPRRKATQTRPQTTPVRPAPAQAYQAPTQVQPAPAQAYQAPTQVQPAPAPAQVQPTQVAAGGGVLAAVTVDYADPPFRAVPEPAVTRPALPSVSLTWNRDRSLITAGSVAAFAGMVVAMGPLTAPDESIEAAADGDQLTGTPENAELEATPGTPLGVTIAIEPLADSSAGSTTQPSAEASTDTSVNTATAETAATPATQAPAAESPTTAAPTTAAPTTAPPATEAPTTAAPTTAPPATEAPTTAAPTTAAPTTAAPTTAPTTAAPPPPKSKGS